MSTAVWLPKRELMEGRLRRVSALSMMSSWTSVAVWRNSITVAMRTTFWREASPPAARAESSVRAGRTRLPPELLLDERQLGRHQAEDVARGHLPLLDRRRVAGCVHKLGVWSLESGV